MIKKKDIKSIKVNKINEDRLNEIANIAFSTDYLKNEKRDLILEDGRTLEQTIKDSYINCIKAQQDSFNPKFHRTLKEKDLSFDFLQKYKLIINKMEEIIYNYDEEVVKIKKSKKYASNFSKKEIKEICIKEIKAYNQLRDFCYTKGAGGKLYFQDMWEYCHYNWDDCFEFIETTKKYLLEIEKEHFGGNNGI